MIGITRLFFFVDLFVNMDPWSSVSAPTNIMFFNGECYQVLDGAALDLSHLYDTSPEADIADPWNEMVENTTLQWADRTSSCSFRFRSRNAFFARAGLMYRRWTDVCGKMRHSRVRSKRFASVP